MQDGGKVPFFSRVKTAGLRPDLGRIMTRIAAIFLCVLINFTYAESKFLKVGNKDGYGGFALVQMNAKKHRSRGSVKRRSRRSAKRSKSRAFRPAINRNSASDWDSVMRRNSPLKSQGELPSESQGEMMPEEYRQWMKNLSNSELDLYLKFRITDAIPFGEVEAEAKRRGIR